MSGGGFARRPSSGPPQRPGPGDLRDDLREEMSDSDQVRPDHAKDAAPGQEAADVVAEVLRHAEEREAAARKKEVPKGPPRWMLPVTVQLGVLALYFLIAQPEFLVVNPVSDPRAAEEVVQQTRQGIYYGAILPIQNYREANGRLPQSLAELGTTIGEQGVEYQVQGDSAYTLIATVGEEVIVFDSVRDDPAEFLGQMRFPG